MPFVLQERELLFILVGTLATLALVVLIQAFTHVVCRVGAKLSCIQWHYMGFLCLTIFLIVSLHTGLTLYILTVAVGVAVVNGASSWRRGFAAFLLCFAFMGMCVPQFSGHVHLEIPSDSATWVSRYYGQVAVWPSHGNAGPHHLFVVYDGVSITQVPCKKQNTELTVYEVKNGLKSLKKSFVSLGDHTRIYALEGCVENVSVVRRTMHYITLLGSDGRMEGITIRCKIPTHVGSNVDDFSVRCLNLASDVLLVNVDLELYDGNGRLMSSGRIHRADGCMDFLGQLRQINWFFSSDTESLLMCFPKLGGHDMLRLLGDRSVAPPFLKGQVPYSLRWLWQMPKVLQSMHGHLAYVVEYVLIPSSVVLGAKLSDLFVAARSAFFCAVKKATPYFMARLKDLEVLTTGVYCSARNSSHVSFCEVSNQKYAEDGRYLLGARIGGGSYKFFLWALDALDFVPGLWEAYNWALQMEWRLTVHCVKGLGTGAILLYREAAQPVWRIMNYAARSFATLVGDLAPLLSDLLHLSDFKSFLRKSVLFLWHLELHLLAAESKLIWQLLCYFVTCMNMPLGLGFNMARDALGWVRYALGLYTTTTLSAHVFVAVIQTAFILIALRNELRNIATREREKYPSFVRRYTGGGFVIMLLAFTRVHSMLTIRYVGAHFMVLLMLIGLSTLPFFVKPYNLALCVGFPCVSSHTCLAFFRKNPERKHVISLSVVKGLFVIVIDRTIGKFVAQILREMFFFSIGALLLLGFFSAWQRGIHIRLAKLCRRLRSDDTRRDGRL
ncbi:hypothetical protein, conserved [Trypanosoma cruzi]|uniref:Uncharacterized protein n=1 Tax=Trypanosoma cruzi (strain CL Brener) TaxID=353153 RepID=Q4DS74_TRYCC|nr:hypothetical protein, conserved [Trypanosoma cruzi]EAN95390.1 hypothetical protein, conserved [Trypanosoma cruzi]|eukprot:XP_817241.1 hypothetical protein [Trypanosoma cruzi strain CL Brener]